ncbi:MAG TPA: NAD(P)-dependent oxidoreductase [Micromonosporaceae bacterium]|nr:NAD(P)-dependent oxidoreductase [Micromonosporaceae bacterium]
MHVLVTGAAGRIGRMIAQPLRAAGHVVALTDLVADAAAGIAPLDVTDPSAVLGAAHGADAIVHLAGIPSEAPFASINAVNVGGTYNVLEAAVAAGTRRVILASSNHAVGFYRRADAEPAGPGGRRELADPERPRPDTFYGWSKAAIESLGALYHDRYGLEVIALRIGTCIPEPPDVRALATWLSPGDAGRIMLACLDAPDVDFQVMFAISDNTRRWWSIERSMALGYVSVDDAERFAPDLIGRDGEPDLSDPAHDRVGGPFCTAPLGVTMSTVTSVSTVSTGVTVSPA